MPSAPARKTRRKSAPAASDIARLGEDLAAQVSPRAGSFIVTLYGDVVEPRGRPLWMGNIIEVCALAGISETLVRTAVSRLVAAGRLSGERQGRRSYYRLTDEARLEFARASRILFETQDGAGWRLVLGLHADNAALTPVLEKAGFARLAPSWWLGPLHEGLELPGAMLFEALPADPRLLPQLVAAHWDVASWEADYAAFAQRFAPLEKALESEDVPSDLMCLKLRLLLVHAYRLTALREPHLPAAALPPDWTGARARALFARLYSVLSPGADRHAATLLSDDGALPLETAIVRARRASLAVLV